MDSRNSSKAVLPRNVFKTGIFEELGSAVLVWESLDGIGKVDKAFFITRDHASPERDHVIKVDLVTALEQCVFWFRELQASDLATGLQYAHHLAQGFGSIRDVP